MSRVKLTKYDDLIRVMAASGASDREIAEEIGCNKTSIWGYRRAYGIAPAPPAPKYALCWDCANAVPDKDGHGCSWSQDLIPVRGCVMEKGTVKSCPQFERDAANGGSVRCKKYSGTESA